MKYSSTYIVGFAAAICLVCAVVVSSAAVALKDRQEANKLLDRQEKVLQVAGLMEEGADLSRDKVKSLYEQYIEPRLVDLESGKYSEELDPLTYDQRKALSDANLSKKAPANNAGIPRVPKYAVVYQVRKEPGSEEWTKLILPVQGKGLWSTLYGFLALDRDLNTIQGITFYEHAETPGLGGEVDNPRWKSLWPGRKAFNPQNEPAIKVIKGQAGPPDVSPYEVDGLSGATITSRGVSNLLQFWLSEAGFGEFIAKLREKGGSST